MVMLFGHVVPMTICLCTFQESVIVIVKCIRHLMYLSVAATLNLGNSGDL